MEKASENLTALKRDLPIVGSSRLIAYFIFFASCLFLIALETYFKPKGYGAFYFQNLTSDVMMQTLPVELLKNRPITGLYFLHIQPPMLDAIRTLLAIVSPYSQNPALLRFVDTGMYFIWMLFFGALNTIIYAWVTRATKSALAGIVASVIWLLHPAPILYATMLEGTFLSALLITWMIYEIWLVSKNQGSPIRLGIAATFAFLTRTVLQWYFAPVLGLSLWLLSSKKRNAIVALAIFCVAAGVYCGKQYLLFHTLSTTTYAGYHKTGILWYKPGYKELQSYISRIQTQYPPGAAKLQDRNNNEKTWRDNMAHSAIFSARLRNNFSDSIRRIVRSLHFNFRDYWMASSRYSNNVIVNGLPWRDVYDWFFSGWRLLSLLVLSLIIWFIFGNSRDNKRLGRFLGLAVVISYILLITHLSNRLNWTEARRLKFFLEPVFLVFIISQLARLKTYLVGGSVVQMLKNFPGSKSSLKA
jgi:hypothetical protein